MSKFTIVFPPVKRLWMKPTKKPGLSLDEIRIATIDAFGRAGLTYEDVGFDLFARTMTSLRRGKLIIMVKHPEEDTKPVT